MLLNVLLDTRDDEAGDRLPRRAKPADGSGRHIGRVCIDQKYQRFTSVTGCATRSNHPARQLGKTLREIRSGPPCS